MGLPSCWNDNIQGDQDEIRIDRRCRARRGSIRNHPNADCQNLGPGNPYTDGGYYRSDWQNSHAFMEHRWHRHHRTHRG
jgi:hypothetical protein